MPPSPPHRQIDSWQAAEDNAALWMRHWGFTDARKTAGGADQGIDVRSSQALAQVKFEASNVGRQTMQQLVGARGTGRQHLLFFTGAGYARTAVGYADVMNIALFKYDLLGRTEPMNQAARQLVGQAQHTGIQPTSNDDLVRNYMGRSRTSPIGERPPTKASVGKRVLIGIFIVMVIGGLNALSRGIRSNNFADIFGSLVLIGLFGVAPLVIRHYLTGRRASQLLLFLIKSVISKGSVIAFGDSSHL